MIRFSKKLPFEKAVRKAIEGKADGIGFILSKNDPFYVFAIQSKKIKKWKKKFSWLPFWETYNWTFPDKKGREYYHFFLFSLPNYDLSIKEIYKPIIYFETKKTDYAIVLYNYAIPFPPFDKMEKYINNKSIKTVPFSDFIHVVYSIIEKEGGVI